MYDFYPEWGPSRHRDEDDATPVRRARYWREPAIVGAVGAVGAAGADGRDTRGDRPDDN